MTVWRVVFARKAEKEFLKIDPVMRGRILDALDSLARDPMSAPNVKALKGEDGFRLRIGDYRVIYDLDGDAVVILVLRAAHRREIYRG